MADRSRQARQKQATEEASMWLERLERTLRQGEITPLREWLEVPLHREAIVQRCMLWHGPEVLAVLGKLVPIDTAPRSQPLSTWFNSLLSAAIAVGFVAIAIVTIASSTRWLDSETGRAAVLVDEIYRNPVGALRQIDLPDGSRITLNTATRVVVNYGLHSRDVTLLEGEAGFEVVPDPDRPFRLDAGQRRFETDGSHFNLHRLTPENAELIVATGEVTAMRPWRSTVKTPAQLRNALSYTYGEVTVHALQGATIGPDWQSVWQLAPSELQRQLAWQQGLILVAQQPLEDALAEIERYTARKFVLADQALRNVRVSAEFRVSDIDGVLRILRDRYAIGSHSDPDDRIVLTPPVQY